MLLLLGCRGVFILIAGCNWWQVSEENWDIFTPWSAFRPWSWRNPDWLEHFLNRTSDVARIIHTSADSLPLFATLLFHLPVGRVPYRHPEDQCRWYRFDRKPILHDVYLLSVGSLRWCHSGHQIEAYWLNVLATNEREYRSEQYPRICRKYK